MNWESRLPNVLPNNGLPDNGLQWSTPGIGRLADPGRTRAELGLLDPAGLCSRAEPGRPPRGCSCSRGRLPPPPLLLRPGSVSQGRADCGRQVEEPSAVA